MQAAMQENKEAHLFAYKMLFQTAAHQVDPEYNSHSALRWAVDRVKWMVREKLWCKPDKTLAEFKLLALFVYVTDIFSEDGIFSAYISEQGWHTVTSNVALNQHFGQLAVKAGRGVEKLEVDQSQILPESDLLNAVYSEEVKRAKVESQILSESDLERELNAVYAEEFKRANVWLPSLFARLYPSYRPVPCPSASPSASFSGGKNENVHADPEERKISNAVCMEPPVLSGVWDSVFVPVSVSVKDAKTPASLGASVLPVDAPTAVSEKKSELGVDHPYHKSKEPGAVPVPATLCRSSG